MIHDEHETPVLFRIPRNKALASIDGVTAIFPAELGTYDPRTMTCYAQVGQHGACELGPWYYRTRNATPAEYAALRRELESRPYGYRLKIVKRITRKHFAARRAEAARLAGRR